MSGDHKQHAEPRFGRRQESQPCCRRPEARRCRVIEILAAGLARAVRKQSSEDTPPPAGDGDDRKVLTPPTTVRPRRGPARPREEREEDA